MKKTLYIHIGLHKTATSSIQEELFRLKEELAVMGVLYPAYLRANHNQLFGVFCKTPALFYEYLMEDYDAADILLQHEVVRHNLQTELKSSTAHTFIISSEDLSLLDAEGVLNMKRYFEHALPDADIKILCCVRELASLVASDMQQRIRVGFNTDLTEYKSFFRDRLAPYLHVFGMENMVLFTYEQAIAHTAGPVGFFCELIKVDIRQLSGIANPRVNPSISQLAVALARFVNKRAPLFEGQFPNVKPTQPLVRQSLKDRALLWQAGGDKFALSDQQKSQLAVQNQTDMTWFLQTFPNTHYSICHTPGVQMATGNNDIRWHQFCDFISAFRLDLSSDLRSLLIDFVATDYFAWSDTHQYNRRVNELKTLLGVQAAATSVEVTSPAFFGIDECTYYAGRVNALKLRGWLDASSVERLYVDMDGKFFALRSDNSSDGNIGRFDFLAKDVPDTKTARLLIKEHDTIELNIVELNVTVCQPSFMFTIDQVTTHYHGEIQSTIVEGWMVNNLSANLPQVEVLEFNNVQFYLGLERNDVVDNYGLSTRVQPGFRLIIKSRTAIPCLKIRLSDPATHHSEMLTFTNLHKDA